MENAFLTDTETLLNAYGADAEKGLTEAQAAQNREKYGANALSQHKPPSIFKRILAAAAEPMILMLIAAGLIALSVNIYEAVRGSGANFFECVGIFAAIALSVIITVVMEGKSLKAFEALKKISDNTLVRVIRDGETMLIESGALVVGDVLLLSSGDKVPADARLIESSELTADESALTGESMPVLKNAAAVIRDEKTPLSLRTNMVYAGNYITGGFGRAVVCATGDHSEFGKIAGALQAGKPKSTPLEERLSRLGKLITVFGVIAAAIVFVAQMISFALSGGLILDEVMEAFVTSIVLIVAAVPEGLPTIVAVSLSISIIRLSKQNALVKKMIAAETIGCINIICSDKTGTLTENKMTVKAFYDGGYHTDAGALSSTYLSHNICLNSTAEMSGAGKFIGNPTECAILDLYERSGAKKSSGKSYKDERKEHKLLRVFPFSSELKHMTTVSKVDGETVTYVKGSPESVLLMCALSGDERETVQQLIEDAQSKAMRVIAFAHKILHSTSEYGDDQHENMESHMVFDGFVAISDPLRADVYEAVSACKKAGVELKILTGDNLLTAKAIADELGLLRNGMQAVTAADIEHETDEELTAHLSSIAVIARSTPTLKLRVVNLLKDKGNVVAVTGDGINDAPALKHADVGVAMGISGTEVSKEACDIVLLDDSFSTIVSAVKWGRGIYENFKRFIQFQLTVNVSSVIVVLVSILIGLKAPFTALQLLWINLIMDGPPALTLGLEPNYENLMERQPIKRTENILTKPILLRIGLTALYVSALFLCQYTLNFLGATDAQMGTVLFTLFALIHLFNAFNCRELYADSIFKNFFKNRMMLVVVAVTFVLQIVFIQFLGAFFGTVPLPPTMWLKIIGLAFSVIVVSEAFKLVVRLIDKRKKM